MDIKFAGHLMVITNKNDHRRQFLRWPIPKSSPKWIKGKCIHYLVNLTCYIVKIGQKVRKITLGIFHISPNYPQNDFCVRAFYPKKLEKHRTSDRNPVFLCGMYIKLIQCSTFMHRNITCLNFLHKNCIYHAFHFVEYFPYGYDAFCKYHSLYYT